MILTICCLGAGVCSCQVPEAGQPPQGVSIEYVMPGEDEPHEGTWLQWPHAFEYGAAYCDRIEGTWVAMSREIVSGERLHIIAYDGQHRAHIIEQLANEDVALDSVDFFLMKTNDVWVRDNGPIFVRDRAGRLCVEGWGFNGWGGKMGYNHDDEVASQVASAVGVPFVALGGRMVLEGGAVELDGRGSLMATRSCVLNANRNEAMTERAAEALMSAYLGATHFIWLDGVAGLETTDMHIDGFARFGPRGTIVTMSPGDLRRWDVSERDIETLYGATSIDGRLFGYVMLPLTKRDVVTTYHKQLGYRGSYVNYYVTSDKVLVPNYNDSNDSVANAIIQTLYPDRRVVGIDVRNLYANGGMVHCVTQQQPR